MWDVTHSLVKHDSITCETWFIHVYDTTHSHVKHDAFTCETRLIHMYNMSNSLMRHDSFTSETWLIRMYDMAHSHVRHDSWDCAPTISWQLVSIQLVKLKFHPSWMDTHQLSRNRWCAISRVDHMMHVCHDFICQCAMSQSSVLHNLYIFIFIFAVTSYPWVRAFFVCAITRSCVPWCVHVCCDSFMCAVTHSCLCVPWLIHVCHD